MSRHDDWLLNQLPAGMLGEDFFVRFVRIFQEQAGTLLAHADNLPYLADRTITPPAMVRWMSQWLGLAGIDDSFSDTAAAPDPGDRRRDAAVARDHRRGCACCSSSSRADP